MFALRECSAAEVERFEDSTMSFVPIDRMRDPARPVCKNDDTPTEEFIDAMEEVVDAALRARIAALKADLLARAEHFEAIPVNARER